MILQQIDIDLLKQTNRVLFVKIELLNKDFLIIDSLEGEAIDVSYSNDASSTVRRTVSLTMYVKDQSFLIGENKKIWLDKYIRIYIGYQHTRTKTIQWYSLGLYLFNSMSYVYDAASKVLTLECGDLMCKLNGQRSGTIKEISTMIPTESDLRDTVIHVITDLTEFKNYIVAEPPESQKQIYHDLKFSTGVTVAEILEEICNLYPAWEFFFDVNGTFVYQPIPTCEEDPILMDDTILKPLIISESLIVDFSEVKNHIKIYGAEKDDAEQIEGEWKDENPDSPFNIEKIGDVVSVLSGDEYEKIYNNDLANQRAEYEGWKATRLNDGLELTMIDIPWLDVNQKIEYTPYQTGETAQWIIKSISSTPTSGVMTVTLIKFYPLYPDIVTTE